MDTVRYLRSLARSWWLVLLVLIAGGAGGYVTYRLATPMYQATVQLAVKVQLDNVDPLTAKTLAGARAQTLAQVAPTQPALRAAAVAAGLPTQNPSVTASAAENDPFLSITVSDATPSVTSAVANAYVKTLQNSASALLGQGQQGYTLSEVSAAVTPSEPFEPELLRYLGLGLAAGLVLGLALALTREAFDRTLRGSDDTRELTGLTVLGTVPRELPKVPLPAASHPRSARTEAYRQVRTTLSNRLSHDVRRIVITSASAGEGKSSVAGNLAVVFARAGHRVALVDADLRRPRIADYFDLPATPGLSAVLAGDVPLEEALNRRDDGHLAVLCAGRIPADPSEALVSPAMDYVLDRLAAEFEIVLLDTPPVLPVADAVSLARHADGVVLVARMGHTTRDRMQRAIGAIERVDATVLGVVPNQAGSGGDRDYGYGYKYGRSDRDAKDADDALPIVTRRTPAAPRTAASPAAPPAAPSAEPAAALNGSDPGSASGSGSGSEDESPQRARRRAGRRRR